MTDNDDAAFNWELLKLLLQVAWADDVVQPCERNMLLEMAECLKVSAAQRAELERHLGGHTSLPPPNFELLRARRDVVVEAAEQIVLVDDLITEDENALLVELNAMVGDDPALPRPRF